MGYTKGNHCICIGYRYSGNVIAKISDFKDRASLYEAASLLQIHPDTIRRWEKKGLIKGERESGGKRFFSLAEIDRTNKKYLKNDDSGAKYKILKAAKTKYKAVELFAGCGGLALGFKNAGIESELLVERDRDCVETLRKNLPKTQVFGKDVSKIDFTPWKDSVDIVSGGFPCQAFSYAGHGKGFGDTRGTLFFEFARCVNEIRPKIALGENVRGLLMHDNGRTLETMKKTLDELGYIVFTHLCRAQFLDVPQKRERLFIIGMRKDAFPKDPSAYFPREKNYTVSLREALRNCPNSPGQKYPPRKAAVMKLIPEGGYWRDLPPLMQKEYMGASYFLGGGKTGMARRLSWGEPSLTLTCNPAQKQTERGHPNENRPLNVREYARVQTFPDDWIFTGSVSSQYRQIGNAVPVNLAFHIGRCLAAKLSDSFSERTMVKKEKDLFSF